MSINNRYNNIKDTIKKILIIVVFVVVLFNFSLIFATSLSDQVSVSAFVEPPAGEKSASLVEFSTPQRLYEYSNVNFTLKIKNTGNVYIYPQGDIKISSGQKELTRIDANSGKTVIQPQQTQSFIINWDKPGKFALGKYHAQLVIDYGGQTPLTAQIQFWIAPVYTTSIILICLLILYFIFRILPIEFSQKLHFGRYVYRRG